MSSSAPHTEAMLTEQREATREQLAAAWQLHIGRVEELLNSGWREQIGRVVDGRFAELSARIEHELRAVADRARRESVEAFNRAARRLQRYEGEEQWAAAVLDSITAFASKALLFAAAGEELRPLRAKGAHSLRLREAPAIASALESRETTVALVSAAELSEPVAAALAGAERCVGIPILARGRAVAVLVAAGDPLDVNGLEAVAALAGPAVEVARAARLEPDEAPGLTKDQEEIHLRARRFARVRAAEMRLFRSDAVQAGRTARRIYTELKEEIDSARDTFERDYLSKAPAMPDYLHSELVRTLANDDVSLLGELYPGPLA